MKHSFQISRDRSQTRPSIWRHRDLRLLIPALTISLVGDALAMIVLILRVHDQGGGTAGIAVLMIAFALPTVLAMGVAGRIADRFDSRPVLLVSSAVQLLACAGLASVENRWSTYAFVIALQCGQAVSSPTWGALTPRLAGDEDMGRVISLQQSLRAVTGIAGAALAAINGVQRAGSILALGLGGLVGGWLGARATFVGAAVCSLIVVAGLVRSLRGVGRNAPVRSEVLSS